MLLRADMAVVSQPATQHLDQPTAACTILKQIIRINEELIGEKSTTEAYYRYENK